MNLNRGILLVGSLVTFVFVGGIWLAYGQLTEWQALSSMLGVVGIMSFFGILALPGGTSTQSGGLTIGRVRFAITSALMMLFIAYFSTVIFWFNTPEAQLPSDGINDTMIGLLTDLLKIVIPFYFAATAAETVMISRSNAETQSSQEGN